MRSRMPVKVGGPAGSKAEERLLKRALGPVQAPLAAVTDRMLAHLDDPVARSVVYLITAGGKRLRPALVLLAGAIGGAPDRRALIDTAAAVEMIHTATLIHDDIIDQSPLRRSQPAFHHRWGTERAVLMGDYLYATAFTLLAGLEAPYVMQALSDVCRQLCRGELREVEARYRFDLTEAEYFDIIQDKTASLISGCCRSGAHLAGASAAVVEQLGRFGTAFGLAFQITDDCLDLMGDQRALGKAVLSDLDKGVLSLPIIYLSQLVPARERDRLFAPLRRSSGVSRRAADGRAIDPALLARLAKAAAASGAIAKAQQRARGLIRDAQHLLQQLPLDGLHEAYGGLAEYAVARQA